MKKYSLIYLLFITSFCFAESSDTKDTTYPPQLLSLAKQVENECLDKSSQACTQWKNKFQQVIHKNMTINEKDISDVVDKVYPEEYGSFAEEYRQALAVFLFEQTAYVYQQRLDKAYREYIADTQSEDYQKEVAVIYQEALEQLNILKNAYPTYAQAQCTVVKSTWGIGSGSNAAYWECQSNLAQNHYKLMRMIWSEFSGE